MKSPIASAWMPNDLITLLNALKPNTVERRRTIAISGCAYSEILQCRSWLPDEIGGIVTGKSATPLAAKFHRPIRIVAAAIRHAGKILHERREHPLVFQQSRLSGIALLDMLP